MVLAKHGRAAHVTYLIHDLLTNILIGASLVLGGAQVVNALSGVNVYAANFFVSLFHLIRSMDCIETYKLF